MSKHSRIVTPEEFYSSSGLLPFILGFDEACGMRVEHCKITRITREGKVESEIASYPYTQKTPNNFVYLLHRAKTGDVYLFEDIYVAIIPLDREMKKIEEKKDTRKLDDVVYYIK